MWYENGNKMSETPIRKGSTDGIYKQWHEDGKLHLTANFKSGVPDGEAIAYYPTGEVMRKVRFTNGKETEGECFNLTGEAEKCAGAALKTASFGSGISDLMQYLQRNLKYPALARRKGLQGIVYIGFLIDIDGSVKDPHIVRSVDDDLDTAALDVVRQMPKWESNIVLGQPNRLTFLLPVRFLLQWR